MKFPNKNEHRPKSLGEAGDYEQHHYPVCIR